MSLDPLLLTAAATVGPASGLVLWTGSRARRGGSAARAFRAARRLLRGSLLLALVLAAVATFRWSHATMGASSSGEDAGPARPPLAGFLVLAVLVLAVLATSALVAALRRTNDGPSRLGIRRRARLERPSPLGLVGGHGVHVPRPRAAAGRPVAPPAVPRGGRDRADEQRADAAHLV